MLASIFRNGRAALVLLALVVYGGPAMAQSNGCTPVTINYSDVVGYTGAPIPVDSSKAPGEVLLTYRGSGNSGIILLAGCQGGLSATFSGDLGVFTTPTSISGVYATNLSGIGIRVTTNGFDTGNANLTVPSRHTITIPRGVPPLYRDDGSYTVELVRTAGTLAAGQITGGNLAVFTVSGASTPGAYRIIRLNQGTFTIQAPTCTVTADSINQTVDLGNWNLSKFATIGSGSDPKNFKIVSSGCDTSYTAVHFTFNGTADTNNADYFAAGGTVSGIGIDVQAPNGTPQQVRPARAVTFAPQYAVGGTYDFTARMVRTGNVRAGTVQAPVQVNVSYD